MSQCNCKDENVIPVVATYSQASFVLTEYEKEYELLIRMEFYLMGFTEV